VQISQSDNKVLICKCHTTKRQYFSISHKGGMHCALQRRTLKSASEYCSDKNIVWTVEMANVRFTVLSFDLHFITFSMLSSPSLILGFDELSNEVYGKRENDR